jgi:hypothetical protein
MQLLFNFESFDICHIKGKPFAAGAPPIVAEAFGNLLPGAKVQKIGRPGKNGKITSSARVDEWTPWVEFAGSFYADLLELGSDQKYLAFRLPSGGLVKKGSGPVERPFYALYCVVSPEEIIFQNFKTLSIYIFRAVFELEDGTKISNL